MKGEVMEYREEWMIMWMFFVFVYAVSWVVEKVVNWILDPCCFLGKKEEDRRIHWTSHISGWIQNIPLEYRFPKKG